MGAMSRPSRISWILGVLLQTRTVTPAFAQGVADAMQGTAWPSLEDAVGAMVGTQLVRSSHA
jgi:hypothetical protein